MDAVARRRRGPEVRDRRRSRYHRPMDSEAPADLWVQITGGPYKGILHTTETDVFTPDNSDLSVRKYGGWHNSWPHFTVVNSGDPGGVSIYQHIPLDHGSRALVNGP